MMPTDKRRLKPLRPKEDAPRACPRLIKIASRKENKPPETGSIMLCPTLMPHIKEILNIMPT